MAFSLWLAFFGASVLLAIAPGPDNLFVLMQSAVFGVRAGMIVVLGLATGLLLQTLAAALGIAAVGDTKEGFERLCDAIEQIDTETEFVASAEESQETVSYARMKQLMSISQAMDAQQRRYPLEESIGKVSAEFAYLYPPGIPIIVPGEQITGQFVRNVRRYMEQGLEVQGLSDTSAETICVAARNESGQEDDSPAKE